MENTTKRSNLCFALRIVIATVLLVGVIVGIWWAAYRSYPAVAEWQNSDSHEVLVMDGERYRRVGTLGQEGLNASDFAIDDTVGRVASDEAVTQGAADLAHDHTYVLYSVKKQTDAFLLLEADGSHTLYFREVAEWVGDSQKSFEYKGKTYEDIGLVADYGSEYEGYIRLGFVSRDSETAHHAVMLRNHKIYPYLLVVEGEDGYQHLFCRVGEDRPLSIAERN